MATTDSDFRAGVGISCTRPFGTGSWFVEGSFLPGVFYRDQETGGSDGLHFPMFRTQIGIGRFMENGNSISVIPSHHSDSGLEEAAGSTDNLLVRYGFSFSTRGCAASSWRG
ncbi:MAG: acyloxyacyl hydrolase [Methyloligellaceae bacterium]